MEHGASGLGWGGNSLALLILPLAFTGRLGRNVTFGRVQRAKERLLMSGTATPGGSNPSYGGPERRKNLPTLELWQENIKALNAAGLTNCQMRYALSGGNLSFFVRFENEVPVGKLNIIFPEVDHRILTGEGWAKFVLTVTINDEGRLVIETSGRYERDQVPLDVKILFERDIGLGVGIGTDQIQATDARNGEVSETSMREIIDEKLKDGERRYSRKDDEVTTVSIEGMVAIASRYLKQLATRRRVLKKDGPA
jgi:hypothetical protein